MDPKKELLELINNSQISEEDKAMWMNLIGKSPEDFAFSILEALSENPEELSWFNDIYKRKVSAFELAKTEPEKAREDLRAILEEEKAKIQELNKIGD